MSAQVYSFLIRSLQNSGAMNLRISILFFLTSAGWRVKPMTKRLPALDKKEGAKVIPLYGRIKTPATAKVIFMNNQKEKSSHL